MWVNLAVLRILSELYNVLTLASKDTQIRLSWSPNGPFLWLYDTFGNYRIEFPSCLQNTAIYIQQQVTFSCVLWFISSNCLWQDIISNLLPGISAKFFGTEMGWKKLFINGNNYALHLLDLGVSDRKTTCVIMSIWNKRSLSQFSSCWQKTKKPKNQQSSVEITLVGHKQTKARQIRFQR